MSLVWGPISDYLAERFASGEEPRLVVCPFIKQLALEHLLELCGGFTGLQVVTRWSPRDILARVSDLSVYPYLQEKRIPLYLHPSIHLKLIVLDSAVAFHTSGNITKKGLGLIPGSNVEIGCAVQLARQDWEHIYGILQQSERVDDQIYARALAYFETHAQEPSPAPHLSLRSAQDKRFSILSLPASSHPEQLYLFYAGDIGGERREGKQDGEEIAACAHDLILYGMPEGLSEREFLNTLRQRFRSHPFIDAIVRLIKEHGSARFGLVTEWLQRECSDKPTPYRWTLKKSTRRLYTWLDFFFEDITWDRPNYSMVLRWNENPPEGHT